MSVNYNGTTINIILKEYSYEKKEIIIIITLFFIISFFIFKIADYSKKNITLDQIKENITNAQKIYVCRDYTDIKRVCRSNKLIKVIDDKETVKKIVELTNSFEEHNGAILLAEGEFSLFFTDEKNKVIAMADFGLQYIIKTRYDKFYMNFEKNEELFELLEIDF